MAEVILFQALKLGFKPENIFGYDIDPTAIEITKERIKKGKRSYLIIGMFFLSPLFGLILNELSYQLHKEELNRIAESKQQELDAMITNGEPILIENKINIPFFETFLVAGLFLTARHESKGEIQTQ